MAVGSTNSLVEGSPDGGGRDAPRASFHLSCSLPKEGGTYESDDMDKLRCRKIL